MSFITLAVPESTRVLWHTQWPRKPGAPPLPRPPPDGYRPPNGIIWGHTFDEFCWIFRFTDIPNVLTMWSRSMIKEHGELYTPHLEETMFECPEFIAKPRRRKPWPVLKVKGAGGNKHGRKLDPPLGMVDEGSDHESSGQAREVFMTDSDDEDGEDSDGEDVSDLDGTVSLPHIPVYDISACPNNTHWRDYIVKKRVFPGTGTLRFFIKPPAQLPSMSPADPDEMRTEDTSDGSDEEAEDDQSVEETSSEEADVYISRPNDATEDDKRTTGADVSPDTLSAPTADLPSLTNAELIADTPVPAATPKAPAEPADSVVELKAKTVEQDVEMVLGDADEQSATVDAAAKTSAPSLPNPDPFSRKGIPVLQDNIPLQYFPDTLLVHDVTGVSMARDDRYYKYADSSDPNTEDASDDEDAKIFNEGLGGDGITKNRTTFIYKRVYPPPTLSSDTTNIPAEEDNKNEKGGVKGEDGDVQMDEAEAADASLGRIAHLHLSPRHSRGTGSHSHVYLSPLTLPEPLSTFKSASARPGTVLVAAKLAIQQRNARKLLQSEAATYNDFPRHLSEEYCGLHLLSPFMRTLAPSCAVVPKFFGYYVPVYGESDKRNSKGKLRYPWQKRSPILLMEDCGTPINTRNLSRDERSDCYSLLLRLHFAEYLHGSFYERNIVMQPGPLTNSPLARSFKTPSFRVIDFGRTTTWLQWLAHERTTDIIHLREEEEALRKAKRSVRHPDGGRTDEQKTTMTDAEALVKSLYDNPYWRKFERQMTQEQRDTRTELRFDQVETI